MTAIKGPAALQWEGYGPTTAEVHDRLPDHWRFLRPNGV
jgi:uncharacterized protein Usg